VRRDELFVILTSKFISEAGNLVALSIHYHYSPSQPAYALLHRRRTGFGNVKVFVIALAIGQSHRSM
jgi:hypothetical protein